ncbi:zinc-dependent alcohol dehydrogenase family protein [Dactylosporangium aurantiacum]|nr:zinc-dependent alcohol dehydrogenase family protein [Dactylosporangium aurantiacum]MDG6107696.1 zinc-dependent alcohol dehydrogenase family protein [Dactylosporangium aurantiacum]
MNVAPSHPGDRPMMHALVVDEVGADFTLRRIARPAPAEGEVVVRIVASGVNPLDIKIRAGTAAHARVTFPAVLGIDLAGVVTEIGAGVTGFDIGDEVYGMAGGIGDRQGSLAEYSAVDADLLAPKPARLSMAEAAALPLAVITAWEGLVDRANVHDRQLVLVHGGAGGVGHVAIQIALARGATVFATGTGASLDVIRRLGAEPIDYRATSVADYVAAATGGRGFDVIFDTVGGRTLDDSFAAVRHYTGHVVSVLGWGSHSLAPLSFRGATYSGVFTLIPILTGTGRAHHGEILGEAARLVDTGKLTPILDPGTYDMSTVALAHQAVESGTARGKVVVDIGTAH